MSNAPLKVAYVINSLEAGGAQFPIPRIAQGLREHDIHITVYALSQRDGLSIPRLRDADIPIRQAALSNRAHMAAARWLRRELRENEPDFIWTSLTQATLIGQRVGRALGLPVISWQHNAFLKPANHYLLRRQVSLSRFWITDSEAVSHFTQGRLGVSADDIIVLPLFVADSDAPQASPYQTGPFRWVSIGRLHRNKGYDLLIKAAKDLSDAHDIRIEIAGSGSEERSLRTQIEAAGVTDRFALLGHVSDIPAFLSGAHAYVQPSRNEGLCIAAHEAMAASLPCVVSDTGQMPLTLGGEGWVIPIGSWEAVRDAMQQVMQSPSHAHHKGIASRRAALALFSATRFNSALSSIALRLREAA